ncbi:uncharacterized protein B0J16DRAFT_410497 [Fusarium flagelliforme]|uniref:uncharacterized protein n=1 Tax=Fusarium flagelliforme TaxID=2675880 RepID=UPI001E8E7282|nr:uncharacterized protein B0J16DRAFT_410497 [Fusarium flagelliforme]KAH7199121.1 hypothetical protein B0J16DRAFT_410497 [Fusarium flagelliforme]
MSTGNSTAYRPNAADMDMALNFAKVRHLKQEDLPDLRPLATPYLTVDEIDIKLFRNNMGDYHFKYRNTAHVLRLELYRKTMRLCPTLGTGLDYSHNHHVYALEFQGDKEELHFWTKVADLPGNAEIKTAIEMLDSLRRQRAGGPRVVYISCVVANHLGWFFFHYLFKPAGLLALFCARWAVSLPSCCCCSAQLQVFVTGTHEHAMAPFAQCAVFEPPPGHPDISKGRCTNCMVKLPIQGPRECSWKSFPQARKRHEREGPDNIGFAGHAYRAANRAADHYNPPKFNPEDAKPLEPIPFPKLTIILDEVLGDQVLGLPEGVTMADIS